MQKESKMEEGFECKRCESDKFVILKSSKIICSKCGEIYSIDDIRKFWGIYELKFSIDK